MGFKVASRVRGLSDEAFREAFGTKEQCRAALVRLRWPDGFVCPCNRANVVHKPRLLSDNGSSYISGDLAEWLEDHGMDHLRGAPYHPQTQGKIERWHQTLKNRILLENYYLPGDLENQISAFVDHYNNQRYHESIGNVTPADAYFGRHTAIIEKRKRIKKLTTQNRRLNHQRQAA